MAEASDESTADISASLKEFWFDSINPRQLEINVSVSIEVRAIGRENFTTIDSLRFVESESPRKHISMALYVAGRGDTMWDIAKRYKTDEKTLSRLNGIDDSSLSGRHKASDNEIVQPDSSESSKKISKTAYNFPHQCKHLPYRIKFTQKGEKAIENDI